MGTRTEQGSILGLDQWNTLYVSIRPMAEPENTFLVRYADIAAVVTAGHVELAQTIPRKVQVMEEAVQAKVSAG